MGRGNVPTPELLIISFPCGRETLSPLPSFQNRLEVRAQVGNPSPGRSITANPSPSSGAEHTPKPPRRARGCSTAGCNPKWVFLAHSNQKYEENLYLGLSPFVPAVPTVLCRTHQQAFQQMFNKYPPNASTAPELLTEARSDQLCWSLTSQGPGASCKQHSMVTRPWERSESPIPKCQGIHPTLAPTFSLPGSRNLPSSAFGNGAELSLVSPGSL